MARGVHGGCAHDSKPHEASFKPPGVILGLTRAYPTGLSFAVLTPLAFPFFLARPFGPPSASFHPTICHFKVRLGL